MPDFPTVPGSLIRATAVDDSRPVLYMRTASDEPDAGPSWVRPDLLDEPYRPDELTLVEVLHDEGRAQLLADLPAWGDLTDVDKGRALAYAAKVYDEGHEYATAEYRCR